MLSIRTLVLIPVALATESVKSGECKKGYKDCDADSKLFCYWKDGDCVTKETCDDTVNNCTEQAYGGSLELHSQNVKKRGFSQYCGKCAHKICEKMDKEHCEDKSPHWKCEMKGESEYEVCKATAYDVVPNCYDACTKSSGKCKCTHTGTVNGEVSGTCTEGDEVNAECEEGNDGNKWWMPVDCIKRDKDKARCGEREGDNYGKCKVYTKNIEYKDHEYCDKTRQPIPDTEIQVKTEDHKGPGGGAAQICISGVFCLLLAMML